MEYVKKFPKEASFEQGNFLKGYTLSNGSLGLKMDYYESAI